MRHPDGTAGGAPCATAQARRIAVFGATGTAGQAAARALRDAGHVVHAIGRNDPRLDGIGFVRADFLQSEALIALLQDHGIDTIVSCIASRSGVPKDSWAIDHDAQIALLKAAQKAGIAQFILLSAICLQKPRLAFQHAKLAFERALTDSGMRHTIIRPTAFFKSLSGQVARVQAGKPYLMFGDGRLTACKPISDADLGRFIAQSLDDPAAENAVLPIGGPGPALTPRDMGDALFRLTGRPPRFRRVPLSLLSGIERGLRLAGIVSPRLAAKAELARIGQYYATESMLLWDVAAGRYDADATPAFGQDRLFDHYADLIAGRTAHALGEHTVF